MSKAILLTYKPLSNTSYMQIVDDIENANWFPEKITVNTAEVYNADIDDACGLFESDECKAGDYDIIINTAYAEIFNAKDENYDLNMISNQVEVVKKEWVGNNDISMIAQLSEMGFETWEDIVIFQVSEAMGFVSLAHIN